MDRALSLILLQIDSSNCIQWSSDRIEMRRYLQDPTMPRIFQFILFYMYITLQFRQTYADEIQGCQLFTIEPERLKRRFRNQMK